MQKPTIVLSTVLLATLISSGKVLAQNLPDEINHPQYLRVYQNLDQILTTKTAELHKLTADKAALVAMIAEMERDQISLPVRNSELQQLIDVKNQELNKLNADISTFDSILGQVGIDLNNLDGIIRQLSDDLNNQNLTARQLEDQRKNARQIIAQIDVRLQRELREEDQSIRVVDGINNAILASNQKINEIDHDRRDLTKDVENFKRNLPQAKTELANNQNSLNDKKTKLKDAQDKIGPVKAELVSAKSKLSQADAELAPLKAKLATLKAELERLSPKIKRLEKENSDLRAQMKANKDKITASGVDALKIKVVTIINDMKSLRDQSETAKNALVAAQEAIKPDQGQLNDIRQRIRELERSEANPTELARLRLEFEAVGKRVAPKRQEIARLNRQVETIALALAPKEAQLQAAQDDVIRVETANSTLSTEITNAEAKIVANDAAIAEQTQANSGVAGQITEAERAIKPVQANRDDLATQVVALEKQETTHSNTISTLLNEVVRLEKEVTELLARVSRMEKSIADAPGDFRRMENHQKQLSETVQQKRMELIREQKLLDRIAKDRIQVQREMQAAQNNLSEIQFNLDQTVSLITVFNQKLVTQNQQRSALINYNQNSISKRDALKISKAKAEQVVANSEQEITDNSQDISTIARQLPIKRSELNVLSPKVSAAETALADAQRKTDDAEVAFQARLAQYDTQLANAKMLGGEKAKVGSTDGTKVGAADAKAKANKLATENAAAEAKWEALRRAYVRGEIAGFLTGRDIGLSNLSEATRGDVEGKSAGALRAKNQAELVLKPAFYLEELDRRIREDVISKISKSVLAAQDSLSLKQSALNAKSMMTAAETIPALTQDEILDAKEILSALDTMIEQSAIEIGNILNNRNRISDPRAAYSIPGAGENANTVNCSAVYKNVKEFVDACKSEYASKYQGLYESAHKATFIGQYSQAFKSQVDNVFGAELARLYPGFLKEATNVGQEVGISTGKMEILKQNYDRAEMASYNQNLSLEEVRVEGEASILVSDYINSNGVLTVSPVAKLESIVSPGTPVTLALDVKNIGQVATSGTSLIRVLSVSPNVILSSREGSLGVVNARSATKLSALTATISETAMPGTMATISGDIIHPGNKYRATRVETFRVEKMIGVNPAVESAIAFDASPKVNNLFGIKKHDIDVTVTPKFNGVNDGYTITLEEIGSDYATILTGTANTPVLSRGAQKKVTFTYKLAKASKGKTVTLRVTVKNGQMVVKVQDHQINPN